MIKFCRDKEMLSKKKHLPFELVTDFMTFVSKKNSLNKKKKSLPFNTRKTGNSPYLERRLRSILTTSVFHAKMYLKMTKIVLIIC